MNLCISGNASAGISKKMEQPNESTNQEEWRLRSRARMLRSPESIVLTPIICDERCVATVKRRVCLPNYRRNLRTKERETCAFVCGISGDRMVCANADSQTVSVETGASAGDVSGELEGSEVWEISCSRDKLEFLIFVLRSSMSRPRWPLACSPSPPLTFPAFSSPSALSNYRLYMGQPIYQSLINWALPRI